MFFFKQVLIKSETLKYAMVAFLLAKLFSDLDNPDCLDFRASRNKNLK